MNMLVNIILGVFLFITIFVLVFIVALLNKRAGNEEDQGFPYSRDREK